MNKLEHYRIKKGLTQTELAEKTGVLQTDISRAEKGVKDLKGSNWVSLAKALDCTVDELLGVHNKTTNANSEE
jgi:transcriptional regulator with XRE-family HTH domain